MNHLVVFLGQGHFALKRALLRVTREEVWVVETSGACDWRSPLLVRSLKAPLFGGGFKDMQDKRFGSETPLKAADRNSGKHFALNLSQTPASFS